MDDRDLEIEEFREQVARLREMLDLALGFVAVAGEDVLEEFAQAFDD
jgi:hypothetical protein